MNAAHPVMHVWLPDLTRVVAAIFQQAGGTPEEAATIATHLIDANLAGHDSHGVVRVPRYVEAVARGHVHFGRHAHVVIDGGVFLLLDGELGFGQTLGREFVRLGVDRAREHGVALVAMRRAGHLGRIGAWAEMACAEGLVSVHFVNVCNSMLVAPFGGAGRRMSTAPVTIGIPNADGDHFILDFATSRIAEGKALVALKAGKKVPMGALTDADGRPTDDPQALYGAVPEGAAPDPRAGAGAIAAMGEHKGSGLALACELLAGALTGSGVSGPEGPVHNGMFSIFVDPEAIDDGHGHAAAVADYIEFVRACEASDPAKPVLVPGDPERQARADRLANGLPLSEETWRSILDTGRRLGVEEDVLTIHLND